ncbi:MAG: NAD(P)-binding domain-containing protein [Pseudolabrys sp.]|nr:NAD(P)-binding domain-containing protein [Pseudolabrys sp.]
MNIGIIGAGNLGTGLTKQLKARGHAVLLSFSKNAQKLKAAADSLGAEMGTPADAAGFGDVVVLATP